MKIWRTYKIAILKLNVIFTGKKTYT